jgi:hypothetical protein
MLLVIYIILLLCYILIAFFADSSKRKPADGTQRGSKRRFIKGEEDLEQLEGVEVKRRRSRKAYRNKKNEDIAYESTDEGNTESEYALRISIEKSHRRLLNRFDRVCTLEEVYREFDPRS